MRPPGRSTTDAPPTRPREYDDDATALQQVALRQMANQASKKPNKPVSPAQEDSYLIIPHDLTIKETNRILAEHAATMEFTDKLTMWNEEDDDAWRHRMRQRKAWQVARERVEMERERARRREAWWSARRSSVQEIWKKVRAWWKIECGPGAVQSFFQALEADAKAELDREAQAYSTNRIDLHKDVDAEIWSAYLANLEYECWRSAEPFEAPSPERYKIVNRQVQEIQYLTIVGYEVASPPPPPPAKPIIRPSIGLIRTQYGRYGKEGKSDRILLPNATLRSLKPKPPVFNVGTSMSEPPLPPSPPSKKKVTVKPIGKAPSIWG